MAGAYALNGHSTGCIAYGPIFINKYRLFSFSAHSNAMRAVGAKAPRRGKEGTIKYAISDEIVL